MTKITDQPIAVGKVLEEQPIAVGKALEGFDSLILGTLKRPPLDNTNSIGGDKFSVGSPVASADKGVAPKGLEGYFKNPKN
ncbi:MAG: hypothetical protein HYU97_00780 [Deltaproteobacteria bacterium]|nr:hypothetical protein [Deltaproteobacteria bacterium]